MPVNTTPKFQGTRLRLSLNDVKAGVTTALLLIPQSMAYAILAGLPPEMGLYAATVPLIIYAVLGSSKQLAVGPVAMISLLTLDSLSGLPEAHSGGAELMGNAALLMAMVGVIQWLMGVFRLGFLTRLLSPSVILGYTFAAALLISSSQLKALLGLSFPRASFLMTLQLVFARVEAIHALTLILGLGALILLKFIQWKHPMFPRHIAVIALGSVLVFIFNLDEQGIKIVGAIPQGFPLPKIPNFNMDIIQQLTPGALMIAFVGFIESFSVGETLARRGNDKIHASRELLALGTANLLGSFFHAYPVSGGLSRTLVNANAGAETKASGVVTAILVFVATLILGPLCRYIPMTVLAALIMSAVLGFIDFRALRRDCPTPGLRFSFLATFAGTLLLGVIQGIGIGLALELAMKIMTHFTRRSRQGPQEEWTQRNESGSSKSMAPIESKP